MLEGKKIALLFLLAGISFQSKAALIWEWEFLEDDLYVDVGDVVNIDVIVRNNAASNETLAITMQLNDGSWGELVNGPDYVVTLFAPGFGLYLEPDQSGQFLAGQLTPRSTADNYGDTFIIDPLIYGLEYQFPPLFPPLTNANGKYASDPLTVHFAAVPIPSAFILFISGIFGLVRISKSAISACNGLPNRCAICQPLM